MDTVNCLCKFDSLTVGLFFSLLVFIRTGTWWSGADDEKVKEGKRLIFPRLRSQPSRSRGSARNRERERKKGRYGDPSSDGAKVF